MSIIQKIIATEVVVHAREQHVDRPAFGPSLFDKGSKWLIEMFTDDGHVGYGETPRNVGEGSVRYAFDCVKGKEVRSLSWREPVPFDWASNDMFGHLDPPVPHRLYEREFHAGSAVLGVEIAVHDLMGKVYGIRACDLYGGPFRESVATDWWMGRSDADHAAQQMQIGYDLGFRSVKMKAAAEDDIVGIVRAIKQVAGDDTPIVIDPNRRFYRLNEAVRIARKLEHWPNIKFEDPFPFTSIHEWQLFRQKTDIPLVMHGADNGEWHRALAHGCCDHVNLAWPAHNFISDARMAYHFGALCWAGSGVDLGVLDAYMLHYSAATRNCTLPGDAVGHFIREHSLIREPLAPVDGAIPLPDGPGLGVSIDQDALAHYARNRFEMDA